MRKKTIKKKAVSKSTEYALLTYDEATNFITNFVDTVLFPIYRSYNEFERKRFSMVSDEIMLEVLKKYDMPLTDAALLLLQLGIETLKIADDKE